MAPRQYFYQAHVSALSSFCKQQFNVSGMAKMTGVGSAFTIATRYSHLDLRRQERHKCALHGRVRNAAGEFPCLVQDISIGGVGFTVHFFPRLSISERIVLSTQEFGIVHGEIRWSHNSRYGLQMTDEKHVTHHFIRFHASLAARKA
jgi:hypothetical protein